MVTHTQLRRAYQPLRNAWDQLIGPREAQGVVVAVSGGPDSRAMLELCGRLSDERKAHLFVAAVDHQTHPQSTAAAHAAVYRAQSLGLSGACLRDARHPARLDEAALRAMRYRLLADAAVQQGAHTVVTAHHRHDVAEGFLMDLLGWGGGPEGAAMAQQRPLRETVTLCRPFLRLPRETLKGALTAQDVKDAFIDPADQHQQNRRAQARALLQHWSSDAELDLEPRLAGRAFLRRADEDALRAWADTVIEHTAVDDGTRLQLAPGTPEDARPALWRRAIKRAMVACSGADLRAAHATLGACVDAAAAGHAGKTFHFSGLEVIVQDPGVVLVRPRKTPPAK